MSLPSLAIRRPVATIMFFLAVVLLGTISLQRLAVDLFPDLNYPRLLVRTRWEEAVPREVAEFISRPVEEAVSAVSGVKQVVSRSRQGESLVTLQFYWGTNMDYAALMVREKLDEIAAFFPEGVERPQVLRLDPSALPIMQIAVSGEELGKLTDLARDLIRRRLEQIRGVAMVEVSGGLERQIEVETDPQRLLTQNLQIADIVYALKANNISYSGGTIKSGRYRHSLRIDGELRSPEDIKKLAVGRASQPVRLGDIARIDYSPKERQSITRYNGKETINLLITKEAGNNTVLVTRQIEQTLQVLRKQFPSLQFFVASRQADFIRESIQNVFGALIWGGVLAFLILFLFSHNFRHSLFIGLAMPVSIIATFVLMHFSNVSLNMMSLGGLALGIGMLVDNSIVVLENILRLKEKGRDWVSASEQGTREVAMPVIASTLTTCAVFLPVIYIHGIAGRLFRDQSLTVAFALLASLGVSLALLPVLASRFRGRQRPVVELLPLSPEEQKKSPLPLKSKLKKPTAYLLYAMQLTAKFISKQITRTYRKITNPVFSFFDTVFQKVFRGYHTLLIRCLNHKLITIAVTLLVFGITLLLAFQLDRRLLPPLRQNELRYHLELPAEATLYQTAEVVAAMETSFLQEPAVEAIFSRIGPSQSILQTNEQENMNQAVITIKLNPGAMDSLETVLLRLRNNLPKQYSYRGYFKGGDIAYTQLLGMEDGDLQIDVQGQPTEILLPFARQLEKQLKSLPEFTDIHLSYREGNLQYRIEVNLEAATMHGITVQEIADHLTGSANGIVATHVKEFDRTIDVLARPAVAWRDSWQDLYSSIINVNGRAIPLRGLIKYQPVIAAEEILRQDQSETIRIYANVKDVSRQQALQKAEEILKNHRIPEDIRVNIAGQQTEISASFRSLRLALLLSLILVYLILAAQFESLRYPLLIILAVPLGLIGAVWLLALTGNSLNVISGIGLIVLTGIVVNDAIIKVDFINQARKQAPTLRQAILDASNNRFRPIIITTITTVFGLLPMAIGGGSGAELRQPLAVVLIGGLTMATFLTLILIPLGYELISSKRLK
ncbi:MAG: efflux RND transporter permease subunit [Calditrichia bacterium]